MGTPSKNRVFGQIQYKNKLYDIVINSLLNQETQFIIQKFKQDKNYTTSSAPWLHEAYHWNIENDKIYLQSIWFDLCSNDNQIMNIFGKKKIFANWVQKVNLLESQKLLKRDGVNTYYQRKILVLHFENGILFNTESYSEDYVVKELKNYITD
ncbi:MAG TPA: hypothetical protein ENK91_08755 [Bacteroidetes bacterium]|nr:hypothetical protein [Bacteroidota bacterium]